MYAIETAKMSSKGQMVMPDSFRKRYGWGPGATLLLIATGDSVVVQSLPQPDEDAVGRAVTEAKSAVSTIEDRLRAARTGLAAVKKLGISFPVGIEDGDARRQALERKHA